jgi:hypothetical protein
MHDPAVADDELCIVGVRQAAGALPSQVNLGRQLAHRRRRPDAEAALALGISGRPGSVVVAAALVMARLPAIVEAVAAAGATGRILRLLGSEV